MSDKRKQRRELILDSAFKLVLDLGYTNTKIIDIANNAGIGKGTVYEYFKSKESLILELINTRVRRDFVKVCESMDEEPTCKGKLTRYFQLEIKTTSKYRANVIDFRNEFLTGSSEISMQIVKAVHSIAAYQFESVYRVIKKGVEEGEFEDVDPYSAAICFMGSISFYLSSFCYQTPYRTSGWFQHDSILENENSILSCLFNGLIKKN